MAEQSAIEQEELQTDAFLLEQAAKGYLLGQKDSAPEAFQLAPKDIAAQQLLAAAAGQSPEHFFDTDGTEAVEDVPVPMEVQKVQGEGNAVGERHAESPVGEDLTVKQAASAGNIKAAKARAAPKSSKPEGEMAIEIAKLRQKEAKLTEVKIPAGSAVPTAPSSNAASSSSSSSSTPPPTSSGPSSAPGKQAGTEATDASQQQLG